MSNNLEATHNYPPTLELSPLQHSLVLTAMHDLLSDLQFHLVHGNLPADESKRDQILEQLAKDHADRLAVWLKQGLLPPADEERIPVYHFVDDTKTIADYRFQALVQKILQFSV